MVRVASGTLILVGGQEFHPDATFEVHAAQEAGGTVLIVATAAAFERPERAVATARRAFEPYGVEVRELPLYERRDAFEQSIVAQLRHARCTYIVGGSPFHLRAVLRATPAFDAVAEAVAGGATLLASSAGAMVLGDPMVDPRGGALTVGLGLIERLSVIPHANTWPSDLRQRTVRLAPPDVVVAEIDEATGLLCDPLGSLRAVGRGSVRLTQRGHEVPLDRARLTLRLPTVSS